MVFTGRVRQYILIQSVYFVVFYASGAEGNKDTRSAPKDSSSELTLKLEPEILLYDVIRARRQKARACREGFSTPEDKFSRLYPRAIEFEPVHFGGEESVNSGQFYDDQDYYLARKRGNTKPQSDSPVEKPVQNPAKPAYVFTDFYAPQPATLFEPLEYGSSGDESQQKPQVSSLPEDKPWPNQGNSQPDPSWDGFLNYFPNWHYEGTPSPWLGELFKPFEPPLGPISSSGGAGLVPQGPLVHNEPIYPSYVPHPQNEPLRPFPQKPIDFQRPEPHYPSYIPYSLSEQQPLKPPPQRPEPHYPSYIPHLPSEPQPLKPPSQRPTDFQRPEPHYPSYIPYSLSEQQPLKPPPQRPEPHYPSYIPHLPSEPQPLKPPSQRPTDFQRPEPHYPSYIPYPQSEPQLFKPPLDKPTDFQKPSVSTNPGSQPTKPVSYVEKPDPCSQPTSQSVNQPFKPVEQLPRPSQSQRPNVQASSNLQNGFLYFKPFSYAQNGLQQFQPFPGPYGYLQLEPTLICQYEIEPLTPQSGPTLSGENSHQPEKPKPPAHNNPTQTKPTPSGTQQASKPTPLGQEDVYDNQPLKPELPLSQGYKPGQPIAVGEKFYGIPILLFIPIPHTEHFKPSFEPQVYQKIIPQTDNFKPGFGAPQDDQVYQSQVVGGNLLRGFPLEFKDQVTAVHGYQPAAVRDLWLAPPAVQEDRQALDFYQVYSQNEYWDSGEVAPSGRTAGADIYEPIIAVNKNLQDKLGTMLGKVMADQIKIR